MNFKDQISADVRSTFINHEEFATPHTFGSRQIWAVVEADQSGSNIEGLRGAQPPAYAEGVFVSQKIIHVDQIELGPLPREDEKINFDGSNYFVRGVKVDLGIVTILLEAYQS
jgi:hypothetical protein